MLTRQNKPDRDAEFCKATEYNHFFVNGQMYLTFIAISAFAYNTQQ